MCNNTEREKKLQTTSCWSHTNNNISLTLSCTVNTGTASVVGIDAISRAKLDIVSSKLNILLFIFVVKLYLDSLWIILSSYNTGRTNLHVACFLFANTTPSFVLRFRSCANKPTTITQSTVDKVHALTWVGICKLYTNKWITFIIEKYLFNTTRGTS